MQLLESQVLIYICARNGSLHVLNSTPGASHAWNRRWQGMITSDRVIDASRMDGIKAQETANKSTFICWQKLLTLLLGRRGRNGNLLSRLLKTPPGYTEKRHWWGLICCSRQIAVEITVNKINPHTTPWVSFRNQQQKDGLWACKINHCSTQSEKFWMQEVFPDLSMEKHYPWWGRLGRCSLHREKF